MDKAAIRAAASIQAAAESRHARYPLVALAMPKNTCRLKNLLCHCCMLVTSSVDLFDTG
jgi:hypothetical protein